MKYTLLVKAEAIQDLTEAFNWYEHKRTGLGVEFLDEVGEYYDRISKNPEQYQSNKRHTADDLYDIACSLETLPEKRPGPSNILKKGIGIYPSRVHP